jgi:predicted transcriptional regulator
MSVKSFLDSLVLEKAPGPHPTFTVFDIIKVLEIIADAGPVGRGKLSDKLGLGEGSTRTLIGRLTDAGLIATSRSGCSLTKKGDKIWRELKAILPMKVELEKNELTFAPYNVAVLIKGRGEKVKKGLEQRDAAVRAGAKGAVTLVFRDNKLVLPTISTDLSKDFPETFDQITRLMKPEENDVVIISGADRLKEAEHGVLAAAWLTI